MLIARQPSHYDPYPVSPSAFQQIEWPLRELHHWIIHVIIDESPPLRPYLSEIKEHAHRAFESIQQQNYTAADVHLKAVLIYTGKLLYPIVKGVSIWLGGLAMIPLIVCLTPFTLLADIVSGAIEVNDAFKKGYPKEHIDQILKKKWISSTVQHCSFFVINALFFYASKARRYTSLTDKYISTVMNVGFCFLITSVCTTIIFCFQAGGNKEKINKKAHLLARLFFTIPLYRFSILLIANYLPEWTRPDRFTIFIEGGNPHANRFHSIWLDQDDSQEEIKPDMGWQKFAASDRKNLVRRNDNTDFGKFLNRFKDGVPPQKLLELSEDYTQNELKLACRKWVLILHPDKNQNDPDAKILSQALAQANTILMKKFEKTTSLLSQYRG